MKLHKSTIIISSLSILLTLPLFAEALPLAANVPGGVAIITLGKIKDNASKPQATFEKQEVLVTADKKQWLAVVGLPLALKPGKYKLSYTWADKEKTKTFRVKNKKYPEQYITLKDNGKVDLVPADEARAVREIATIKQLKLHWTEDDNTDLAFILPAEGRLSGNFGLKRFFNGQARSPHAGLDVAVASGTPIRASAAGKVLASDDYFFNGKTIFLDHGNGLITMYCHLSQSDVQPGDTVTKGQQIALSGQSGRATGPHLHWSVIMNGAMVDPSLFISAKTQRM